MTKFLILNTFKKIIDDRRSFVVFKSGEEYSLDALSVHFNQKSIESLIETNHIQKQEEPVIQETIANDIQEPIFETMYKITQTIQDKDGVEIEVGKTLTKEELKDKGFTKKKIETLSKEQKLMEIKVVK